MCFSCAYFPAISSPLLIFLFNTAFNLLVADVVKRVVGFPVATSRFKESANLETEL